MSASDGEPREGVGRREAQSIVDRIAVWANGRSEIRGLALAGSYARGSERPDSDVDVLLLTNEPARFIDTVDWLDVLGNPPVVRSEHFGVVTERRVRLPSGLEVEFGIAALGWAQVDPVDAGTRRVVEEGFRVLHDPDGRLADLQAAVSSSDEHIRIDSYDPTWPARFEQERAALAEMIGQWITGGIHHVGSTAVPGLDAKPVIDILVGVADLERSRGCVEPLARLDYMYARYRPHEMLWFCKPNPAHRTHHLHLVPTDSSRYRAELAFRDYLRSHSDVANDYAALKRRLATKFDDDREAYTNAKGDFVRTVIDRANAAR